MKCMCQITQSLSTVIPPMHGFQMPIIYLPKHAPAPTAQQRHLPVNQINEIEEQINKRIRVKAQGILSNFKGHVALLQKAIGDLEQE